MDGALQRDAGGVVGQGPLDQGIAYQVGAACVRVGTVRPVAHVAGNLLVQHVGELLRHHGLGGQLGQARALGVAYRSFPYRALIELRERVAEEHVMVVRSDERARHGGGLGAQNADSPRIRVHHLATVLADEPAEKRLQVQRPAKGVAVPHRGSVRGATHQTARCRSAHVGSRPAVHRVAVVFTHQSARERAANGGVQQAQLFRGDGSRAGRVIPRLRRARGAVLYPPVVRSGQHPDNVVRGVSDEVRPVHGQVAHGAAVSDDAEQAPEGYVFKGAVRDVHAHGKAADAESGPVEGAGERMLLAADGGSPSGGGAARVLDVARQAERGMLVHCGMLLVGGGHVDQIVERADQVRSLGVGGEVQRVGHGLARRGHQVGILVRHAEREGHRGSRPLGKQGGLGARDGFQLVAVCVFEHKRIEGEGIGGRDGHLDAGSGGNVGWQLVPGQVGRLYREPVCVRDVQAARFPLVGVARQHDEHGGVSRRILHGELDLGRVVVAVGRDGGPVQIEQRVMVLRQGARVRRRRDVAVHEHVRRLPDRRHAVSSKVLDERAA